jgi:hypothetical protein
MDAKCRKRSRLAQLNKSCAGSGPNMPQRLNNPSEASTLCGLNPLCVVWRDPFNGMEVYLIAIGPEDAIGHTTMEINMRVQRGTEAIKI